MTLASLKLTRCVFTCATVLALAAAGPADAAGDAARWVDPLIGTGGDNHHTFPGAVVPFGMVQFSPVAGRSANTGGYDYADPSTRGFALTRLSGAGCTNGGDLPIMPLAAPFQQYRPEAPSYYATFTHAHEAAAAGRYGVKLDTGISVDLTATKRTGLATFRFHLRRGWLAFDVGGGAVDQSSVFVTVATKTEIRGHATSMGFCNGPARPTVYFVARFNRPIASAATWNEDGVVTPGVLSRHTINTGGALLRFELGRDRAVKMKVGVSYVGLANAALNLRRENRGWNADDVAHRARTAWNALLDMVRIGGGTTAERRTFYTALYHSLIHPTVFNDVNGQFLGRDQRVHVIHGYTRYTNVSGWDVYRTQLPLLALLAPRVAGDLAHSLVAGAQESGWLSKWAFGSWEPGVMVGDPADPLIASIHAFGGRPFDTRAALAAMVKGATVAQPGPYVFPSNSTPYSNARDLRPDASYVERPGLDQYLRLGYVPLNHDAGFIWGPAATTLEYALDDFALARFAQATGRAAVAAEFTRRSHSWRLLVDAATGYIEPRFADGSFPSGYSHAVESGFVEGSSAQYTWFVPHDVAGLIEALGDPDSVAGRLDSFFTQLNAGQDSQYAWLGNEPSLGAPWLYLWLDRPWRTQEVVRRAVTTLWRPRPAGLPGDDDMGTLSSWYVWSALGLYPAIPGVGGFSVGSPLFSHAVISGAMGTLTVVAPRAAANRPYVRSLRLDGRPYGRTWLPLARLRGHHVLSFGLAAAPQRTWGTGAAARPPSFP